MFSHISPLDAVPEGTFDLEEHTAYLFLQVFTVTEEKLILHCSKDKHKNRSEAVKRYSGGAEMRLQSQCITLRMFI